jgi:hypothetical protein
MHIPTEPFQKHNGPKKEMKGKEMPAHLESALGGLLAPDGPPKSEESRTKDANGLEELE